MTNEELVSLVQSGVDRQSNMGQLWKQNRNFIVKIALPYSKSCELEDLIQEGYFGLEKAVTRYDPGKGVQFLTYAEYWIRMEIQRYCQTEGRLNRVPVRVIELISKYQKFASDYKAITGLDPIDEEYCIFLKIKPSKLKELREYMVESYPVSIDSPIPGTEDFTVGDTIPDDFQLEESFVEWDAYKQGKRDLWDAVDSLTGRQSEIIKRYFQKDETLETISAHLEISKERVRQLKETAIRILRDKRKVKESAEIFGYGSYGAYHWGGVASSREPGLLQQNFWLCGTLSGENDKTG